VRPDTVQRYQDLPVAGVKTTGPKAGVRQRGVQGAGRYDSAFSAELAKCSDRPGISLSTHARARLEQAGRGLDVPDMERLARAVSAAGEKGARESLVLMDGLAFVVNVPSRTVITAVGSSRLKEGIFTNIDSAVILGGPDLKEGARGVYGRQSPAASREVSKA